VVRSGGGGGEDIKLIHEKEKSVMSDKEKHPLHLEIGREIVAEFGGNPELKIIRDPACGGGQHIPLFRDSRKKRETQYCNVDLLILKNGKVRVILEIEEADIKPTQICGKFLTSALSLCYIHDQDGGVVDMDASVLFIQLPLRNSKIVTYQLLFDSVNKVIDAIRQELS
jgi:hypothetical protein